jgi:hypothetical protein
MPISGALTYLPGSPVKEPSLEALIGEPLQRETPHSLIAIKKVKSSHYRSELA